jgi:hypothetical protein
VVEVGAGRGQDQLVQAGLVAVVGGHGHVGEAGAKFEALHHSKVVFKNILSQPYKIH